VRCKLAIGKKNKTFILLFYIFYSVAETMQAQCLSKKHNVLYSGVTRVTYKCHLLSEWSCIYIWLVDRKEANAFKKTEQFG